MESELKLDLSIEGTQKTLLDMAKDELADFQRKKDKILSKEDIKAKVLETAKLGKKQCNIKGVAMTDDLLDWIKEEGIKATKEYMPDGFWKKLVCKLFKINCVRFDWDDDVEQEKNGKDQEIELLKKQIKLLSEKLEANALKIE